MVKLLLIIAADSTTHSWGICCYSIMLLMLIQTPAAYPVLTHSTDAYSTGNIASNSCFLCCYSLLDGMMFLCPASDAVTYACCGYCCLLLTTVLMLLTAVSDAIIHLY